MIFPLFYIDSITIRYAITKLFSPMLIPELFQFLKHFSSKLFFYEMVMFCINKLFSPFPISPK